MKKKNSLIQYHNIIILLMPSQAFGQYILLYCIPIYIYCFGKKNVFVTVERCCGIELF